jgi:hypothetical protein
MNREHRHQLNGLVLVAAFVASASPAIAGTIDLSYAGGGRGQNVRITHAGAPQGQSVFAGQLRWNILNVSPDTAWLVSDDFRTYCIDLAQSVSRSSRTYTVTDPVLAPMSAPMGDDKARLLRNMFSGAGSTIFNGAVSNTDAAAFQLAVWDIVSDYRVDSVGYGLGLGSGDFTARGSNGGTLSDSVQGRYADFIAQAVREESRDTRLVALTNPDAQDQITIIPAPASAALLCMAGIVMARRRRAGV